MGKVAEMRNEHTAAELKRYLREGRCEAEDPTAAPLQGPILECGWPLRGWLWADEMYVATRPPAPPKAPPPPRLDEDDRCFFCGTVVRGNEHYCGSRGFV